MDLRAPLQLQSMIKSMTDVVLPAIDPANEMAMEQAQLILGMMHLMAMRLPLQFHYDVDALGRYLVLARELLTSANGGPLTTDQLARLETLVAEGETVLSRARATPSELEAAVLELRSCISVLVETVWQDGEPRCRGPVGKAVLAASKTQIQRERAWFVPQGWDADTSAYSPIENLIEYPTTHGERDS